MVAMSTAFGNPDAATPHNPHGGPPFQGWRMGWGFGKAKGPGMAVQDPALPQPGRFTPSGERYFQCNAFWRKRHEVGQAASFGVGDRPDYGRQQDSWSVAPNAYGDISKAMNATKRKVHRPISLKERYPSMVEKYRQRKDGLSGPGPAKYDTRIAIGESSWAHTPGVPRWTMQTRHLDMSKISEDQRRPGPAEYTTWTQVGKNSPIHHGTLYDITLTGRHKDLSTRRRHPGPGQYNIVGTFDKFELMPGYRHGKPLNPRYGGHSGPPSGIDALDVANPFGVETVQEVSDVEDEDDSGCPRGLQRIESAPAV